MQTVKQKLYPSILYGHLCRINDGSKVMTLVFGMSVDGLIVC